MRKSPSEKKNIVWFQKTWMDHFIGILIMMFLSLHYSGSDFGVDLPRLSNAHLARQRHSLTILALALPPCFPRVTEAELAESGEYTLTASLSS